MKGAFLLLSAVFLSSFVSAQPEKIVVGYFTSWSIYDRNYWVYDIDASQLTHINYAFANLATDNTLLIGDEWADTQIPYPGMDPTAPLRGNFGALNMLKQENPHLKTLISIGGWTWSGLFSNAALTTATRQTFASSCVRWIRDYGFDGIDVDWEYPVEGGLDTNIRRPEDGENYILLLAEIRRQLQELTAQTGQEYLLTIAAPAAPQYYRHYDLEKMDSILDFINIMTYDYNGAWDLTATGMNAPLYNDPAGPFPAEWNVQSTVNAFLQGGLSPEKLVVGVPFYGRGWAGVPPINNGLYQSATSAAPGTWEPGIMDWDDIRDNYLGSNGYMAYKHAPTNTSYTYSQQTGVFVSYDDAESIELKGAFANRMGVAGGMIWSLESDRDAQLLTALNNGLHGGNSPPPPPPPPMPTTIPSCEDCLPGTSGPCQHEAVGDNTCFPLGADGNCPPGSFPC